MKSKSGDLARAAGQHFRASCPPAVPSLLQAEIIKMRKFLPDPMTTHNPSPYLLDSFNRPMYPPPPHTLQMPISPCLLLGYPQPGTVMEVGRGELWTEQRQMVTFKVSA